MYLIILRLQNMRYKFSRTFSQYTIVYLSLESPLLSCLIKRITTMISGTYVPIVIMPHDITGITIAEGLILILLLIVITVLFMKFIIWYMHHII